MTNLQWIPVSERLPEKAGNYLCTIICGEERETTQLEFGTPIAPGACGEEFGFDGWAFGQEWPNGMDNIEKVVAWQPLPIPYKEDEK